MARGWESKSVEAQLDEAVSEGYRQPRLKLSAEEVERVRQRELLELARQRTLQLAASSTNERYRKLLDEELRELDARLAQLG